nr:immunoglobulin heavy chain junction region [Mus musculus]
CVRGMDYDRGWYFDVW